MGLKMTAPTQPDINAATNLIWILDALRGRCFPSDEDDQEAFDITNGTDCRKALQLILDCLDRPGALERVVFSCETLIQPENQLVHETSEFLDFHPNLLSARRLYNAAVGDGRALLEKALQDDPLIAGNPSRIIEVVASFANPPQEGV